MTVPHNIHFFFSVPSLACGGEEKSSQLPIAFFLTFAIWKYLCYSAFVVFMKDSSPSLPNSFRLHLKIVKLRSEACGKFLQGRQQMNSDDKTRAWLLNP